MYKYFIYLAGLLLVGSFLFYVADPGNSDYLKVELYDLNNEQKEKILNIKKLSLNSQNIYFENLKVLDTKGDFNFLKDIIGDTPKLIFRFNDNQCSAYIDHALEYLKRKEKLIGPDNIIIMGGFYNSSSHSVFTRLHPNLNQEIYNYNENFNLPVDSLPLPYFLIINSSLKTKAVFVPIKEIPKRTEIELNHIMSGTFLTNFRA